MSAFASLIYPVAVKAKLDKIKERENEKLECMKKELKSLEADDPSNLYWRIKHGKTYFWKTLNRKQEGITKDNEKIYSLARLKYLRMRLSELRNINEERWRQALDGLVDSFEQAGLDLTKIILTKEQYLWAASPQSENPLYREKLIFKTNNGVLMRSKSEQAIGNMLELLKIPYRYEPEMILGDRVFYPDFVIMIADGKKIILEHLGIMDSEDYVSKITSKLIAYAANGWMPGRNVFFSFESDTRDPEKIKAIINDMLVA